MAEWFRTKGSIGRVEIGRSASEWRLTLDGRLQSAVMLRGSPPQLLDQHWLCEAGGTLRPDASSMLAIGLGGGVMLEKAPENLQRIDVIEIEPAMLVANAAIAELRDHDPLADERVRVEIADAREWLVAHDGLYDLIVSQPAQPDTACSSGMYDPDFLQKLSARLAPGGLMLQWLGGEFTTVAGLGALVEEALGRWRHVSLHRPSPSSLVILASDAPLPASRWTSAASVNLRAVTAVDDGNMAGFMDALEVRSPSLCLDAEALDEILNPLDPLRDGGPLDPAIAMRLRSRGLDRRLAALGEVAESKLSGPAALAMYASKSKEDRRDLTKAEAAVVQAWQCARSGDWDGVAALDDVLTGIDPSEACYPSGLTLAAQWRVDQAYKDGDDELARAAMGLIDRALAVETDADRLMLRAAAAFVLKDPSCIVETAASAVDAVGRSAPRLRDRRLATLERFLREVRAHPVGDRLEEVRNLISREMDAVSDA